MAPDRDVTTYFTRLAGVYAEHRPSYPPAAIVAALDGLPVPARAVDVGCGTGICSRLLAEAGAEVTGVDPNEDMLAEATRGVAACPRPPVFTRGRAEALPLPDDAADLVLCGQSFHWFDAPVALAEFRRVLGGHGRLALLWNVRERGDAFTHVYETLVDRAQDDARRRGLAVHRARGFRIEDSPLFTGTRKRSFDNPHRLDRAALLGRARSASYFPREGPLRRELEAELERQFDLHQRDGVVVLRQRAELTLAETAGRGVRS